MLLDRAADHLPLKRVIIDIADCLSGLQPMLAARQFHFDQLIALGDANLSDTAILVDRAARDLLQIVAVLHGLFLAAHARQPLNIDLHTRTDDAAFVAGSDQPYVGLVVRAIDLKRRDFDLLHQLPFVGIHRVEPIDHVVLVGVSRRVAQRA